MNEATDNLPRFSEEGQRFFCVRSSGGVHGCYRRKPDAKALRDALGGSSKGFRVTKGPDHPRFKNDA